MITFRMPQLTFDTSVQSEEEALTAQEAISKVSPFSVHDLAAELAKIENHGTTIYIWNLS